MQKMSLTGNAAGQRQAAGIVAGDIQAQQESNPSGIRAQGQTAAAKKSTKKRSLENDEEDEEIPSKSSKKIPNQEKLKERKDDMVFKNTLRSIFGSNEQDKDKKD